LADHLARELIAATGLAIGVVHRDLGRLALERSLDSDLLGAGAAKGGGGKGAGDPT
jgi:hypothetical protein